MRFDAIRIVLVATTHPGNIGSTARAMKTMGFGRLYLVSPKAFPDIRASEMAAGADDILDNVVLCGSLQEALADCKLVIGSSARPRDIDLPGFTPAEAAQYICTKDAQSEVALVFGREHAGLTNEELLHCHFHMNIPSNPEYSSLNLAQAVQIMTYEIRMKLLSPVAEVASSTDNMANSEEVHLFYQHLKEVLIEIGFLKPSNPRRLMQRVKRMFNRIQLEEMEIRILRGILSQIQNALKYPSIKK